MREDATWRAEVSSDDACRVSIGWLFPTCAESRSSLSSRTLVSVFCFRLQTGFVTRVDASIGIIVTFYDNVHGLVPAKSLAKLHRGSSATNGGSAAPPAPLSAAELASSYV